MPVRLTYAGHSELALKPPKLIVYGLLFGNNDNDDPLP
jgi:hypothetical protein